MTRVWLRAAVLALLVAGAFAGLTVYYSTEKVPRCLASGTGNWRPPRDRDVHRYEVVVLDRDACFFDMDRKQQLAGALRVSQAKWLQAALARPADTLRVADQRRGVVYETRPGLLGFRVLDLHTKRQLYLVRYEGFAWNPRFGPDPPSHGLSLAPDRPELWVLDSPNSAVHLFDVGGLPGEVPRRIVDVRLSKPLSGNERSCTADCGRIGSLLQSGDGRFVYVGDSGDVIDARTRETVANLEALHNSRIQVQVDWVNGKPVFPHRS